MHAIIHLKETNHIIIQLKEEINNSAHIAYILNYSCPHYNPLKRLNPILIPAKYPIGHSPRPAY